MSSLPGASDRADMVHEIAKLMLEQAGTFLERTEAVETALSLGMPLSEIEEYLDWLELVRSQEGQDEEDPNDEDQDEESKDQTG